MATESPQTATAGRNYIVQPLNLPTKKGGRNYTVLRSEGTTAQSGTYSTCRSA
jgi:hypothetical protein